MKVLLKPVKFYTVDSKKKTVSSLQKCTPFSIKLAKNYVTLQLLARNKGEKMAYIEKIEHSKVLDLKKIVPVEEEQCFSKTLVQRDDLGMTVSH